MRTTETLIRLREWAHMSESSLITLRCDSCIGIIFMLRWSPDSVVHLNLIFVKLSYNSILPLFNRKHQLTFIIAYKAVSLVINSRALTGKKPCINKAIHALLMHGYACSKMFQYVRTRATDLLPLWHVYCPALDRAQSVEIVFARHRWKGETKQC